MVEEIKRIARFALFGAIGFGIGTIILGTLGVLGGATLGLALRRKMATLALVGGVGFLAGFWVGWYSWEQAVVLWEPFATVQGHVVYGSTLGAIGGAALGLALWDWQKIIGLAFAGALGFGIGMMVIWPLPGFIGGALLGAALGFLEKEKPNEPD